MVIAGDTSHRHGALIACATSDTRCRRRRRHYREIASPSPRQAPFAARCRLRGSPFVTTFGRRIRLMPRCHSRACRRFYLRVISPALIMLASLLPCRECRESTRGFAMTRAFWRYYRVSPDFTTCPEPESRPGRYAGRVSVNTLYARASPSGPLSSPQTKFSGR